jgi:hypothetical protein
LKLFHQHGTYICNNLEFSHLSTSNHYLSDVAGLLWLGIMVPEFVDSEYFFDLGLGELLSEMDKQVLPDAPTSNRRPVIIVMPLSYFSIPSSCANKMTSRSKINIGPSCG